MKQAWACRTGRSFTRHVMTSCSWTRRPLPRRARCATTQPRRTNAIWLATVLMHELRCLTRRHFALFDACVRASKTCLCRVALEACACEFPWQCVLPCSVVASRKGHPRRRQMLRMCDVECVLRPDTLCYMDDERCHIPEHVTVTFSATSGNR